MKRGSFLLTGAGAMLAGCAGTAVPSGSPVVSGQQPASHSHTKRNPDGLQLLGSLLLVPYDYAPEQFADCDGATMDIKGREALFSLLYTKFGGNGRTTFALPNMKGLEPQKGLRYVIAIDGTFPSRKFRTPSNGAGPLLGQLLLVPWLPKFVPPKDWAVCDGKLLDIRPNPALYSVMGNKFGGNGQTNFALPDLRGKAPHKNLTYLIALDGRYPFSGMNAQSIARGG